MMDLFVVLPFLIIGGGAVVYMIFEFDRQVARCRRSGDEVSVSAMREPPFDPWYEHIYTERLHELEVEFSAAPWKADPMNVVRCAIEDAKRFTFDYERRDIEKNDRLFFRDRKYHQFLIDRCGMARYRTLVQFARFERLAMSVADYLRINRRRWERPPPRRIEHRQRPRRDEWEERRRRREREYDDAEHRLCHEIRSERRTRETLSNMGIDEPELQDQLISRLKRHVEHHLTMPQEQEGHTFVTPN